MPITISALSKSFGAKKVFDDFFLHIKDKKITYLLGPNGCGKTTLINIMLGLLKPSAGTVSFNGKPISLCRKDVAVVFDEPPVYPNNSGYDNLKLLSNVFDKNVFEHPVLKVLNLDKELLKKKAKTLSLGQRHRLAVAAAIIRDPLYMILDEPAIGLDSDSWESVKALLLEMKEKGKLIIVTGHNYDLMEDFVDEIVVFANTKVIFEGSLAELKENYTLSVTLKTDNPKIEAYGYIATHDGFYQKDYDSQQDFDAELLLLQNNGIRFGGIESKEKTLKEMYNELLQDN